ncbi:hypothetical protein FOCC_FOCC008726 [Frankliniella occidentalis]|nr:hypothetical protein FOCC_FOCC008726 [Frankliniella occidentalis]
MADSSGTCGLYCPRALLSFTSSEDKDTARGPSRHKDTTTCSFSTLMSNQRQVSSGGGREALVYPFGSSCQMHDDM